MEDEMHYGGDPRRCSTHGIVTSSPDGLHDAPCGACEAEMEADDADYRWDQLTPQEREAQLERNAFLDAEFKAQHARPATTDDVPF